MLLVEKGDHARGVQLLQKATSLAPQAASIRLNLARALIKTGQKDAARRELDELDKLGDKFSGQSEVAQLRKALWWRHLRLGGSLSRPSPDCRRRTCGPL